MRRPPLLLLLSCCSWVFIPAEADGNVGCLFSETLCTERVEWCYDDYAFGKCLQMYGNVEDEDLERHELTTEELRAFERELQRLLLLGYRWSHAYTQCILQAMLYAAKNGLPYDEKVCDRLIDQDLTAALGAFEADDQVDPQSVAFVRFTPSSETEPSNFADEVYYPPKDNDYSASFPISPGEELEYVAVGAEDPDASVEYETPRSRRADDSFPREEYRSFSRIYNTPGNFRRGYETRDSPDGADFDFDSPPTAEEILYLLQPENAERLRALLPEIYGSPEEVYGFDRRYNTPDRFRQGYESRDFANDGEDEISEPRIYTEEDDRDRRREGSGGGESDGRPANEAIAREYATYRTASRDTEGEAESDRDAQTAFFARLFNSWKTSSEMDPRKSGAYTEGGLVYVGESSPTDEPGERPSRLLTPELGALLADYEWGFRRRERLDVKKPGPPFDVKNQHFNHDSDSNHTQNAEPEAALAPPIVKKELHEEREETRPERTRENYDVDSSYAYVGFKDSIRTWKEGERVVRTIGDLLHLEPSALSYPRVDRNEVTFRVEENGKSLNASEVARRIDGIKDELKRKLGVEVTSAGVGDKAKLPAVLRLDDGASGTVFDWGERGGVRLALMLAGVAAAVSSGAVLLAAHFYYRRRSKLAHLSAGDTEPSRDYQDLCRARMAGKWQTPTAASEKPAQEKQETSGQRITSLSRESDNNSPSTRSSTSSWSEEPALTNMDISTGHMVLTYMEDHLKNKDRLEQEWRALCAYEAEPSACVAAELPENAEKNRKPGVLPYDHSRLVLNDVTNANSSDYINASTITDHDPRNPAYVAAQGPLPHTAPDFWQMVWEQGSVVMVMLTRLTEGGTAMCHRYWPEEGSDLYHIYEVHLVSEHIWCDDYLVRSFYLKNLKTGETRTVTQFHFLSWPDRGVPSSTKALLEFRRKVNKSYRGRSCPIVVHCSDGASRTGTYCLIDMVLNRMAKGAKEIDIAATLEHIRDQRPHTVTTKQQFEFVLMAVAEEVHAILKALPAQLQQQHEKREKELAEKEKTEKQEK